MMMTKAAVAAAVLLVSPALARDSGQWEHVDPAVKHWYETLEQPDRPHVSCCGEADAYYCDDYYAREGKAYCRVNDDRDDVKLNRPHVPNGTEIEIPPYKLKYSDGNPTGHAVVFLGSHAATFDTSHTYYIVYCYVQGIQS